MTIASETNRVMYTCTGTQKVYPYTFKIFEDADMRVIHRTTAGVETTLTLDTDYTVSGAGESGGGNVTLIGTWDTTPPSNGEKLLLMRQVDLTQDLDLVNNDAFDAESLELALDRIVCQGQQMQEQLDRAVVNDPTSSATLTWDDFLGVKADCDADAASALASKNAAALSETNAGSSASTASTAKTDAETAQGLAEDARDAAQTAQGLAEDARDLAQAWASKMDGYVEGTDYSAAYNAWVATQQATAAQTNAGYASNYMNAASVSAGDANTAKLASQAAQTASEAARDLSSASATAAGNSATAAAASAISAASSSLYVPGPYKASTRPYLYLDFSGPDALPSGMFTRASTGTYTDANGVLRTAAINQPRIEYDPITGVCKGLLIEESRKQLLSYTEQFDNAYWTLSGMLPFGSGSVADATTAPDGNSTADKLVPTSGSGRKYITRNVSGITSTATVCGSVFIKPSGVTWICVTTSLVESGYVRKFFNISTGAVGTTITSGGASIGIAGAVPYPNGVWRVYLSTSGTANTNAGLTIDVCDADNTLSFTGDGTSGIYLWGAQLEPGAFPTSYFPCVATSLARAADVCSLTLSSIVDEYGNAMFSSAAGTMYVEGDFVYVASSAVPISISDGSGNNVIRPRSNSAAGGIDVVAASGGVTQWDSDAFAYTSNTATKIAVAFAASNYAFSVAGGAVKTQASGSIPTVTTLEIGGLAGVAKANGHIRRVALYNRRLSNADLQAITS